MSSAFTAFIPLCAVFMQGAVPVVYGIKLRLQSCDLHHVPFPSAENHKHTGGDGSFLPSPPVWVMCCYVLLQEFEPADHGKLFCTSVSGVDNTDNRKNDDNDPYKA